MKTSRTASAGILGITSILDNSAPHNLNPVPTASVGAGREAERRSVEAGMESSVARLDLRLRIRVLWLVIAPAQHRMDVLYLIMLKWALNAQLWL